MRKYRFYRNERGWYIDLKWFPFNKEYLAMVAGADTLLDILAGGEDEVTLQVSTSVFPYADGVIEKHVSTGLSDGAFYFTRPGYTHFKADEIQAEAPMIWLCPVTLWVFLKYPKKIYYKIL